MDATVAERGQITLPKAVRDALGLVKGTKLKVELIDPSATDTMFTILMGDEVAPRRQFIEDNALNVRNLDI